jgi:DNA-binding transcriptional LysR family regulator
MDWDDLRLLHTVLDEGSLSAAARVLGLSQPTVGRRIRALEEAAGGPLIERLPDGIRATPLAQSILPHAHAMQRAADEVARVLRTHGTAIEGTVRIACGFMVGRWLAGRSTAITEGAPELEVVLDVRVEMVNLDRGDADVALRNRRPESGNLYAKKIGYNEYAVYGAPSYVEADPAARTEERYATCRWVGHDEAQAHLPSMRWLAERRARPPQLRCTSSLLHLDAVIGGAGLGLLPTFLGEREGLVRLTEPLADLGFDLWVVAHRDARALPRVRHVMDRLEAVAREELPLPR